MDIKQVTQDVRLQKWATAIQECNASGLNVKAWCREQNVPEGSYYYWLKKVRRAACDLLPEKKIFIPVQVPEVAPRMPSSSLAILIRKGDVSIEFCNDVPLSTITSILEFLQC